ncbi:MAG TPA: hypothetical protein VLF66_11740, partial [Thermoanaerobaculia bacterium]|nr:hypothetical protein [Thermoanaerobaculia bacterium]
YIEARLLFIGLLGALLWPAPAAATPPATPISIELSIDRAPRPFERSSVTIRVVSVVDAPATEVEVLLPDGIVADQQSWLVDLEADVPVELSTSWTITGAAGNVAISARALSQVGPDTTWGDMKSIPLHVGVTQSQRGWRADMVPVAELVEPGDAPPVSRRPTPFPRGRDREPDVLPAVPATRESSAFTTQDVVAAGTVTLTGRWQYHDRAGLTRNIDQQVIEIRRGNGNALSPRVYCFTSTDGTFSCSFAHPGSTMRVWVRSWTNYSTGPTRLGVFEGIEISGGCGSSSIDCSYPVQTGEITCASGSTCAVGTWVVSTSGTGEPWLGAHQMEQDLIRSWKRLRFDFVHPSGSANPGPARITYPVPSGHGTHAHVNGTDSWISIEPPNQQSADIVAHEYGHAVMSNLWAGYSPKWPTRDCPSPHYIHLVSGPGCALSEGFANFWAWYSNQFYDGDGSILNDGPIFNWPGGPSTNLETRDGGTYQSGDQVEGNVAAAMGDFYDSANDGPSTGPADRLSDGVQHIWHTTYSQSDNRFSEWWSAYWGTFGHDGCTAKDVLHYNTINYSTPSCGGGDNSCSATASCANAGGGSVSCTGTTGDCFSVIDCYAYCDGQYYFCPDPGGGLICPL